MIDQIDLIVQVKMMITIEKCIIEIIEKDKTLEEDNLIQKNLMKIRKITNQKELNINRNLPVYKN